MVVSSCCVVERYYPKFLATEKKGDIRFLVGLVLAVLVRLEGEGISVRLYRGLRRRYWISD
jgi:hypothetical protein